VKGKEKCSLTNVLAIHLPPELQKSGAATASATALYMEGQSTSCDVVDHRADVGAISELAN